MVYGDEAVLPTDLDYGAPRVIAYKELEAKEYLEDAMDQLDGARDVTLAHSTKYQQALHWYHDQQVKGRAFSINDLVLQRVQSTKDHHNLSPLWEGPYVIVEVLRPRTYKLATVDGKVFANA
jgi:hypothetical protein